MEKKVLATVGEKEITNLDVESALKSLDPYQAMHFQTEEGKKQLLEDLVNQELFYMQAKENQLHNDEAFKSEMKKIEENMLKQYAINKVLSNVIGFITMENGIFLLSLAVAKEMPMWTISFATAYFHHKSI